MKIIKSAYNSYELKEIAKRAEKTLDDAPYYSKATKILAALLLLSIIGDATGCILESFVLISLFIPAMGLFFILFLFSFRTMSWTEIDRERPIEEQINKLKDCQLGCAIKDVLEDLETDIDALEFKEEMAKKLEEYPDAEIELCDGMVVLLSQNTRKLYHVFDCKDTFYQLIEDCEGIDFTIDDKETEETLYILELAQNRLRNRTKK